VHDIYLHFQESRAPTWVTFNLSLLCTGLYVEKDYPYTQATRGGFPSICHNELRDMTAGFLTEVCQNWATTSTAHRQTSYTRISKQGGWCPSRHCSWQHLGKRPKPCLFLT